MIAHHRNEGGLRHGRNPGNNVGIVCIIKCEHRVMSVVAHCPASSSCIVPHRSWWCSPQLHGVEWVVLLTWLAASATAATTRVSAAVEMTLEDVYMARPKPVVVEAFRADTRSVRPITVYVQPPRDHLTARPDGADVTVVVKNAGHDPPAAVLSPPRSTRQVEGRGDVDVTVRVSPHALFYPDPVLCPYDLHADVDVPLSAHYFGHTIRVPHLSGNVITLRHSKWHPNAGKDTVQQQVHVVRGAGLPTGQPSKSHGDLYVFSRVRLPELTAAQLASPLVQRALSVLSSCH